MYYDLAVPVTTAVNAFNLWLSQNKPYKSAMSEDCVNGLVLDQYSSRCRDRRTQTFGTEFLVFIY